MLWADNCQKFTQLADAQSKSRSPQYQCTYQIWWKSIVIYSSYCPEIKTWMYCGQIALSKMDNICLLAIPKQMSTISMHIPSLVKIHKYILKLSSRNKKKTWMCQGQKTLSKSEAICPQQFQSRSPQYQCTHKIGENPLTFTKVIT